MMMGVRKNHDLDSAIKPANWSVTKCMELLNNNPITGEADVAFLQEELSSYKELAMCIIGDTEQGKQWCQDAPHLQLIHDL